MIYLNNIEIIPTIFPDKTSQIWGLPEKLLKAKKHHIIWKFESEAEFMHLAQLRALLGGKNVTLHMPYLPYARQDKPISNDSTFALGPFSNLLHWLFLKKITVFDPHSEYFCRYMGNARAIWPKKDIKNTFKKVKADLICYPDDGAFDKYTQFIDQYKYPSIRGKKQRNQKTGKITKYEVLGYPKDKTVLIVDDICDGGMTFILLAKKLKKLGAKEIHLYVSHGLFSKGTKVIRDAGIERIFTKEGELK